MTLPHSPVQHSFKPQRDVWAATAHFSSASPCRPTHTQPFLPVARVSTACAHPWPAHTCPASTHIHGLHAHPWPCLPLSLPPSPMTCTHTHGPLLPPSTSPFKHHLLSLLPSFPPSLSHIHVRLRPSPTTQWLGARCSCSALDRKLWAVVHISSAVVRWAKWSCRCMRSKMRLCAARSVAGAGAGNGCACVRCRLLMCAMGRMRACMLVCSRSSHRARCALAGAHAHCGQECKPSSHILPDPI